MKINLKVSKVEVIIGRIINGTVTVQAFTGSLCISVSAVFQSCRRLSWILFNYIKKLCSSIDINALEVHHMVFILKLHT